MIPQIIYLIILTIALLISASEHGKVRKGAYNFWTSLVAYAINFSLLYFGGFFAGWGW